MLKVLPKTSVQKDYKYLLSLTHQTSVYQCFIPIASVNKSRLASITINHKISQRGSSLRHSLFVTMCHIKAIAYDNESIHFRPFLVLCHTTISLTNIVVNGIAVVVYTFFAITLWKFLPQNITYGNDKSSTSRWLVKWMIHSRQLFLYFSIQQMTKINFCQLYD